MKEPNITIECECPMRLRSPGTAVQRALQLCLIFRSRHQGLTITTLQSAKIIIAWTDKLKQ